MTEKDIFKRIYGFDENDITRFFGGIKQQENHMLSWDEAVAAMKAEGFGYSISRMPNSLGSTFAYADKITISVTSDREDPTAAINDLLAKCRARWPKPDPWDAMSLDELIQVCLDMGWSPMVAYMGSDSQPYWVGSSGDGYLNDHYKLKDMKTAADALRSAMRKRKP